MALRARSSAVVWFKTTDLRLRDHEPLFEAHQRTSCVTHLFVFNPAEFGVGPYGFPKCGHYRSRFLLEAVHDLRAVRSRVLLRICPVTSAPPGAQKLSPSTANPQPMHRHPQSLKARGSNLILRTGDPAVILPAVVAATKATAVFAHAEVRACMCAMWRERRCRLGAGLCTSLNELQTPPLLLSLQITSEEASVERAVAAALSRSSPAPVPLHRFWGNTLYHLSDLPFRASLPGGPLANLPPLPAALAPVAAREGAEARVLGGLVRGGAVAGGTSAGAKGTASSGSARAGAGTGGAEPFPATFTAFRKRAEAGCRVREPLPIPTPLKPQPSSPDSGPACGCTDPAPFPLSRGLRACGANDGEGGYPSLHALGAADLAPHFAALHAPYSPTHLPATTPPSVESVASSSLGVGSTGSSDDDGFWGGATAAAAAGIGCVSSAAPAAPPDSSLSDDQLAASLATLPPQDPRGVLLFRGGETAALARLQHYGWGSGQLSTYKDTRNGLLGEGYRWVRDAVCVRACMRVEVWVKVAGMHMQCGVLCLPCRTHLRHAHAEVLRRPGAVVPSRLLVGDGGWPRCCIHSLNCVFACAPSSCSTKLSPWLALGCVSARTIAAEVRAYEAGSPGGANESTHWVLFELLWRDFFKVGALAWGASLFKLGGPAAKRATSAASSATSATAAVWRRDPALLRAWCTGHTGYPFVDAAMRELLATGFQSNRSRQNVASFLAKDLGLDWRAGAEWFESVLIDHDPCANYVSTPASFAELVTAERGCRAAAAREQQLRPDGGLVLGD